MRVGGRSGVCMRGGPEKGEGRVYTSAPHFSSWTCVSVCCLQGCPVLMDAEVCPSLQTAMRNYFMMLEVRRGGRGGANAVVFGGKGGGGGLGGGGGVSERHSAG